LKKLSLILLFLFIILQCKSQITNTNTREIIIQENTYSKKEAWKTIALYTGAVIANGIGDGLKDSGHKEWGHFSNSISISLLVLSPSILQKNELRWYESMLSYGFIRFGFFDAAYNTTRGLPLNYLGTSSFYDIALSKTRPSAGVGFAKFVGLTVGISIPFNSPTRRRQRQNEKLQTIYLNNR
jgi:hypothetical protein